MGTRYSAPDNTDLCAVDLLLGSVNVSQSLAEVKLSIVGGLDTFQLDQRGVLSLRSLCSLEAKDSAFGV